jgi:hypothetical protein
MPRDHSHGNHQLPRSSVTRSSPRSMVATAPLSRSEHDVHANLITGHSAHGSCNVPPTAMRVAARPSRSGVSRSLGTYGAGQAEHMYVGTRPSAFSQSYMSGSLSTTRRPLTGAEAVSTTALPRGLKRTKSRRIERTPGPGPKSDYSARLSRPPDISLRTFLALGDSSACRLFNSSNVKN